VNIYGAVATFFIKLKLLENKQSLQKAIEYAQKKVIPQYNQLAEKLGMVRENMIKCANLVADFERPLIDYLNNKGLPCESMSIDNQFIVYIMINGKKRPIYDIRTYPPIKLRQYKGPCYSTVPQIYRKEMRKFMRQDFKLNKYIF